jgi:hypothetical protein
MKEWTRSTTLALASQKCAHCRGIGLRLLARKGESTACDCVLRAIFRVCYNRFRYCCTREKYLSKVTLEIHSGPNRRGTWGRKEEEYIADFINVSRRSLTEEEYRIFRFRYLLGGDWRLACRRLNVDRGTFFHTVYRIQHKLGLVFYELEPYGLFPLDEYFHTTYRNQTVKPLPMDTGRARPVRPPVRKPFSGREGGLKAA